MCLHLRQRWFFDWDRPAGSAASAGVLTQVPCMKAEAEGLARERAVFHFENGDYRKETPNARNQQKQAKFAGLARPLSC